MSLWFDRLDPRKSLSGRLVALVISVALATSAAQLFFLGLYRTQVLDDGTSRLFLSEVVGARALLVAATPSGHEKIQSAFSDYGFELRQAPPPSASPQPPFWLKLYDRQLRSMAPEGIDFAWERGLEPVIWAGFDANGQQFWVPYYLTRTGGQIRPIIIWLLLMLGIVLITGFIAGRLFTRPLLQLQEAVDKASQSLDPIILDRDAPREVRRVGERFDALLASERARLRERELLLAGVAHDLRTPATRLRLRAELIEEPDERTAMLGDVALLSRMIDQFLDSVRGSDTLGMTEFPGKVLHELLEDEPDVTLVDKMGASGLPIGPDNLRRITRNLVDNALRHGRAPVIVELSKSTDACLLKVTDHGSGIPLDQQDLALQPFHRLDQARAPFAGAGLGLAIVDRLVRETGGALTFKTGPASFTITVQWPLQANA